MSVLIFVPTHFFPSYRYLTGGREVGAIYNIIYSIIGKLNILFLAFLIFPLIMFIPKVNSLFFNTIISISTPFVHLVVAGHGGCCQIFPIRDNSILGDPFWKLSCWLLELFTFRTISLEITVLL